MKISFNDFSDSFIRNEVELTKAFKRTLKSGWYILGNEVAEFEKEFSEYLNMKYSIGVANGLEALQISLLALNIKAGDEVITTPLSAFATTLAILNVGAVPVFVDTNSSGQIDANQIEKKITNKTKAIIPVHLFGNPVDLDAIQKICKKNKLYLIEDAAQAHGSVYKNQYQLGTRGVLNIFSFYPTKNLGAYGDGGAIVSNSKRLAEKCKILRDYGQSSKYIHSEIGLNSRLDELQASFLRLKLKKLDTENIYRNKLANMYTAELAGIAQIKIISPQLGGNGHLFVITTQQRDALQQKLKEKGIETLVHYPLTIPDQPVFKERYKNLDIPNARQLTKQVLSLPCHPLLDVKQVEYICQSIRNFFYE